MSSNLYYVINRGFNSDNRVPNILPCCLYNYFPLYFRTPRTSEGNLLVPAILAKPDRLIENDKTYVVNVFLADRWRYNHAYATFMPNMKDINGRCAPNEISKFKYDNKTFYVGLGTVLDDSLRPMMLFVNEYNPDEMHVIKRYIYVHQSVFIDKDKCSKGIKSLATSVITNYNSDCTHNDIDIILIKDFSKFVAPASDDCDIQYDNLNENAVTDIMHNMSFMEDE